MEVAALALLEAFLLDGKVIGADAGRVRSPFVQNAVKKGASIWADQTRSARPPSGQCELERDAGCAGAAWRADGRTPQVGRAPSALGGAVRRSQPVSGPSVCLTRRTMASLDRMDASARRTKGNAPPRLDGRRGVFLVVGSIPDVH